MAVEQDIRLQIDTLGAPAKSRGATPGALRRLSLLLRRSHMYIALFLTPWMAMYALSTLVFNHFERVAQHYGGQIERYEKDRELAYSKAFPPGASPRMMAEEILRDLNLSGTLRVEQRSENRMVILRLDPLHLDEAQAAEVLGMGIACRRDGFIRCRRAANVVPRYAIARILSSACDTFRTWSGLFGS
jgi:hypothetical protein